MPNRIIHLYAETTGGFGRSIIRGITRYARGQRNWTVLLAPMEAARTMVVLRPEEAQGVIARIASASVLDRMARYRVPVVNATRVHFRNPPPYPAVWSDLEGASQIAFEHLSGLGFRHFAFCGLATQEYYSVCQRGFADLCAGRQAPCTIHTGPTSRDPWREEIALVRWLRQMGQPTGIYCCNDQTARQVVDAAVAAGIPVPHRHAVIGCGNDDLFCEAATIPLSSVDLAAEQIGYQAAALLDKLMAGKPSPSAPLIVPAGDVVQRRSSEVLQVGDPVIREALTLMGDADELPHTVGEVVAQLPVSRRAFEHHFRAAVGQTPMDYLHRQRMKRVRELLQLTDLSVDRIAERCGYSSGNHLSNDFKKNMGVTISAYRRSQHRT